MRRLLLAAVVACVAAAAITALGCGGGDDGGSGGNAVGTIEKLLGIGQNPGTTNKIYLKQLPPGLPEGLPEYPGSELVGSTVTEASEAKILGVLSETGDSVADVYAYFEDALMGAGPWQIEVSSYVGEVAGVQFKSLADSSVTGAVLIQPSGDDDRSLIFLSVQTLPQEPSAEPFELKTSKQLPLGWPPEVLVYPDSTITDSAWVQTGTSLQWQITILAHVSAQEVVDFYKTELAAGGFTVTEGAAQGGASLLSFEATKGNETWRGAATVQTFAQDPTYAQAMIQASISVGGAPSSPGAPTP